MNADRAQQVVRWVSGYWPSPAISDEEAVAWVEELTNPSVNIQPDEALSVLRRCSYAGQVHRPRPGQVIAAVQAERRARARIIDTSRMLEAGRAGAVSPERASQWVRACRRVAKGDPIDEAKVAEGLVS